MNNAPPKPLQFFEIPQLLQAVRAQCEKDQASEDRGSGIYLEIVAQTWLLYQGCSSLKRKDLRTLIYEEYARRHGKAPLSREVLEQVITPQWLDHTLEQIEQIRQEYVSINQNLA